METLKAEVALLLVLPRSEARVWQRGSFGEEGMGHLGRQGRASIWPLQGR